MNEEKEDDARPGESKEERFKRLAEPRVNRALDKIRLINNLATSQYSFSAEQASKIIRALRDAVSELEDKFQRRLDRQKEKGFEL